MRLILSNAVRGVVLFLFLISCLIPMTACNKNSDADVDEESEAVQAAGDSTGTSSSEKKDGKTRGEAQGVPVEVTLAYAGKISSYILLSSTIETESQVQIFSQAAGLVDRILVEEGDHVRKGAVLARLDDKEYALDEAKAEVAFHKLQNEYSRIESMYHDDLISVEQYENTGYDLKQAELEWQKAKLLLEYTQLEAQISGVVSERSISVGDRITTNTKVFSIVNLDSLIAVVHIPEREIGRVMLGQDVKITSDFIDDEELAGWVKRISPVVDPNSGTFKVTVGLERSDTHIRPGMFVNVHIVTGTHENAILVPRDAIVYDGGREYIFLASEESTATRIELDKGFSDNRIVEVLSGVASDDMVIVVGQSGIKDGAQVTILDEKDTDNSDEDDEELAIESNEHSQKI